MAIVISYESPCAIIQGIVEIELSSVSALVSANFYLSGLWVKIANEEKIYLSNLG
jgi:hypothetical protein